MASDLNFDGKRFLPSGEASRVSGYSTDYIGQLCRSGKLVCRRVGRGWFVEEGALLSYKALDLNHSPAKARRLVAGRYEGVSPVQVVPPQTPPIHETSSDINSPEPVQSVPTEPFPSMEEVSSRLGGADAFSVPPVSIPSPLSRALLLRAGTLVASFVLVFGPYLAKDVPALQSAAHTGVAYSAEVAQMISAFELRAFEYVARAVGTIPERMTRLAVWSESLGESAFRLTADAVQDIFHDPERAPRLFFSLAADRVASLARESHDALASLSAGVRERVFAFVSTISHDSQEFLSFSGSRVASLGTKELITAFSESAMKETFEFVSRLAERYDRLSVGTAALLLTTKESIDSFHPIDDVARTIYAGVNRGIFSLRDPLRRFLGIGDGSGGAVPRVAGPAPSTVKVVYAPPVAPPARVTERVIERTIERQVGPSSADVDQKLSALQARLAQDIASLRNTTSAVQSATQSNTTYINNVYNAVAQTNNLDRVEDLDLINPEISFGTMTSTALTNVSGTFTALSGNSLTVAALHATMGALTGDLTVGGNATVSGNLAVYGTITPAAVSATSSVTAPYFTATSTTATSTFAGGLAVQTDKFVVESGSGNVGLGTTSPQARLALAGYANATNPLLLISTSTPLATSTALVFTSTGNLGLSSSSPTSRLSIEASTPTAAFLLNQTGTGNLMTLEDGGTAVFVVVDGGNVGVGTTSPFAKLSVAGNGYFDGGLTATNITATGTATFGNLALTGSTTLQNFTFVHATGTRATTTNFFSSDAVFTRATTTSFFTSVFNAISSIFSSLTSGSGTIGTLTATSSATLSYAGADMLITTDSTGKLVASSTITARNYLATSSVASIFPYASSTALTVSGTGYFGTASTTNLTVSALTTTRIPFTTTGGAFTDDGDLTFTGGNLLTATYASTTALSSSGGAWFATTGGSVGVGTSTPGAKLDVTNTSSGGTADQLYL
ncbi:MAG: hypothetical protein AAB891_01815, partial [Patescibacteria group bacterium]